MVSIAEITGQAIHYQLTSSNKSKAWIEGN